MIQQAVILAAGRGSRLGKLTDDRPKSMLPILGRPIIARVMDRLREAGIRRFVVVTGDQNNAVATYLRETWNTDSEIVVAAQPVPTGTVDALTLAQPHITGPFLLSAVDNLTGPDHVSNLIATFNRTPEAIASLSLLPSTPEQIRVSSGVIIQGDRIVGIEEKPDHPTGRYASIMLWAFGTAFFDYLPHVPVSERGEREIVSAIQASIADGKTVNYAITDWRLHLTHERDLLAINTDFLAADGNVRIESKVPDSVHLLPPICIDPNVRIGQSVRLGPGVYLESGTTVGEGAVLENTLVLSGATVPEGDHCSGCIITRHARIAAQVEP